MDLMLDSYIEYNWWFVYGEKHTKTCEREEWIVKLKWDKKPTKNNKQNDEVLIFLQIKRFWRKQKPNDCWFIRSLIRSQPWHFTRVSMLLLGPDSMRWRRDRPCHVSRSYGVSVLFFSRQTSSLCGRPIGESFMHNAQVLRRYRTLLIRRVCDTRIWVNGSCSTASHAKKRRRHKRQCTFRWPLDMRFIFIFYAKQCAIKKYPKNRKLSTRECVERQENQKHSIA